MTFLVKMSKCCVILSLMVAGAAVSGLGISSLLSLIEDQLAIPYVSDHATGIAWLGAGIVYGWLAARYGFIPLKD